jgi:predicted ABC-type ATPase
VVLLFFGLENVEMAKDRVRIRVAEGGRDIPKDIIKSSGLNPKN